ncbi:YcxB family protein [Streptomyces viridochromogenes]|nr:YcxB family protein [Streptomyces viridochromogenes]
MDHQGRDLMEEAHSVKLAYRPTRADILTGIRTRDRIRKLTVVRAVLMAPFVLVVVLGAFVGVGVVSLVLSAVCACAIWFTPHLQAHHVLKTVSWQGEYRTTVSGAGISAETEHTVLLQRWSIFRGYRETRDHLVLLSRDPNILLVEILPKRGVADPADIDRLRTLLSHHLHRV